MPVPTMNGVSLWEEPAAVAAVAELAPGAVLLRGALRFDEQQALVDRCRAWARAPAGMRAPRLPNGAVMSAKQVCLGWHWYPYRYSRTTDDGGGEPVKAFPGDLGDLARALATAADPPRRWWDARNYRPDVALVNLYDGQAKMGMHQDADERSGAPVVSISLGDAATFRLGNSVSRARPWQDVALRSGDVLIFGGPARQAFHGVPRVHPGTSPPLDFNGGRLNITIRESGLG